MTTVSARVARLAAFVRRDGSTILGDWNRRIETLPASEAPSLATHGARVLEWLASSLEEVARHGGASKQLPTDNDFSAARAIAELALLAETIHQVQPAPVDEAARDILHRLIDGAVAHSLARGQDESVRLRKRLRLAMDVALVGSWEIERLTGLVGADPRTRELFGTLHGPLATADDLTAQLHADDRGRVRGGIAQVLDAGRPFMDECRVLRPDGSGYRWVAIAADVDAGLPAPSMRLLGIVHDITDRKRTEEEHARVVEELSRAVHISELFIGILSHDLRDPISAVLAGTQLLGLQLKDERPVRVLARITSSTERMGRMIDQLLDFTRARLGDGIPLRRDAMDLASLTQSALEDGKAATPAALLRLTVCGDTTGTWDRDRVSQILSNLIGNALQHGDPAHAIEILLDGVAADHVELSIENQGAIPPDLVPVIFNPFRGTLQKRGKSMGLGLGLYVARQMALAHGGELEVEATATATRFRLRLPRSPQTVTRAKQDLLREEELTAFERMAAPRTSSVVTARLFGAVPLKERVPLEHSDIIERYRGLLDTALHRKAYRGHGEGVADDLRALSDRLGDLGAGPREVTEVHAQALRHALRGAPVAKSAALISEGRLLALELMGNLASYYRQRSRGQVRTVPREGNGS